MIWSLLIAGVGQLLVALVFSEVVAQYPGRGRGLPVGPPPLGPQVRMDDRLGLHVGALRDHRQRGLRRGPVHRPLFGFEATVDTTILCSLGILVLATFINYLGTKVLAQAAIIGFTAELIGALVVGIWLLRPSATTTWAILFDSFGAGDGTNYLWAFAAAGLIGIYKYYGFEACGDVAEEVRDPRPDHPQGHAPHHLHRRRRGDIRRLALASRSPTSRRSSPVRTPTPSPGCSTRPSARRVQGRPGVVLISFLSCAISLQAAASRLAYRYGRDGMIVGSRLLRKFSQTRHVPPYAVLLAGLVPGAVILLSKFSEDALTKIISFAALGIYIGFRWSCSPRSGPGC